jgi:hypothetical protein
VSVLDDACIRVSVRESISSDEPVVVAGLVSRLLGVERSERLLLLNDASLYLQALERGWTVLTRNVRDFDCFDQILPADRVLYLSA